METINTCPASLISKRAHRYKSTLETIEGVSGFGQIRRLANQFPSKRAIKTKQN
jgi:hypothetical protein